MNYKEVTNKIRPECDKVIDFFKKELAKVRTGSASPALVEDIIVEAFGQKMTIKQLAAISVPERKQIMIQPWDHSYLEPIEKALFRAELGGSPVVDKDVVRVNLPPLNQEYRQTLAKLILEKAEQTRQTIRRWREESWAQIQAEVKQGKLAEDDKFKGKEELQKIVDEYHKKIEELVKRKTQEVQEI